jgi:hypothetical protein
MSAPRTAPGPLREASPVNLVQNFQVKKYRVDLVESLTSELRQPRGGRGSAGPDERAGCQIMPEKEEQDGDAADEGSVQHGESASPPAEAVAELSKQFAQTNGWKIMKTQSWTTSLSMTSSMHVCMTTSLLDDGETPPSPPKKLICEAGAAAAAAAPAQQSQAESLMDRRNALDAHESRMLKAFGAAYIKRTKSDSEIASENAIARIMALRASIQEQNDRSNKTLSSCQSLMDACGEAIAAWFKGLSGAALKRAIKEVRACVWTRWLACILSALARTRGP